LVLDLLLCRDESLTSQLLVLQFLKPFFDVFNFLLSGGGGEGGLNSVGDGGRHAVGGEAGRGAIAVDLRGCRHDQLAIGNIVRLGRLGGGVAIVFVRRRLTLGAMMGREDSIEGPIVTFQNLSR
jgi:hypothetical protein